MCLGWDGDMASTVYITPKDCCNCPHTGQALIFLCTQTQSLDVLKQDETGQDCVSESFFFFCKHVFQPTAYLRFLAGVERGHGVWAAFR